MASKKEIEVEDAEVVKIVDEKDSFENEKEAENETKKMDTAEMKIKEFLSKSAEVSKNAFSKASDAVQKFSDKSVLKIQIQNQKGSRQKKYSELGSLVYSLLSKKSSSFEDLTKAIGMEENVQTIENINKLLKDIQTISKEIKTLENSLEEKNKK